MGVIIFVRKHYNEISKQCREEHNRMTARIELLEILAESDEDRLVTIYAVVDQRQDYLSVIKGL